MTLILIPNIAEAKTIKLNETVTSTGGCKWTITGWIDVNVEFGWPPISVNNYDITISGPCGKHHFIGMVIPPSSSSSTYGIQGTLINIETMKEEDINSSIFLHSILSQLKTQYDE